MTDSKATGSTASDSTAAVLDRAAFGADGLLPAIIQEQGTKDVLMLGYMDREALRRTLTEGRVTFWSRSRREYWRKGDTSGHAQYVKAAAFDCDADTLLVTVEQIGAACHTGAHACFDVDPLEATVGAPPASNTPPSDTPPSNTPTSNGGTDA
ncbi:phosphoribosyl-AMP cyclohydrolase [Galbitalea sp. SE-J8]|uniref:phosphoribosyl-AMP cyclohydrolase n=1 Tax=Galbitalea sp. SE-J8 TaxID=3054952 RepID=UPI00259C867E|nr:phosphoribosyl-AMP cyclohydrolase [Galbitalea sp. SE-J8]MDM4764044.1 phosphoribosyl-AMP cyclohydrolase [Galbitalea sp. SE-J8]